MLKRLGVALAALFAFVSLSSPIYGAGTVPGFSLAQQLDSNGTPLSGCRLYVIQAGTVSTPQNAYSDSGLTLVLPNPIICDAYGRISQFFVADGSIKLRLTKSNGVQVFSQDGLLVVGASSGGGGGSPVDATTVLATGDFKLVYNTGVLSGFVRCNGRTIGNATSGATERANADTSALFSFLYTADTNLSVSGGRGASAAADYAASKTLTLPDCKSRTLAGLSDMGGTDSGRLTTTYFGCTGLVLGCAGGSESTTLTAAQIPSITSANVSQSITVTAVKNLAGTTGSWTNTSVSGGGTTLFAKTDVADVTNISSMTGSNSISVTSNNTSGAAHRTVQPSILVTIYIKL